jgi:uncharacterized RDD family membrane protein YckC
MTTDPIPDVRSAVRYVGFWARVFASLVDSVLLLILMTPLTVIAFGSPAALEQSDPAHFLLSTVVPAMVVLIFWARRQATPGKILIHARIVDADTGAEPRVGQLVLRYLGYFVSTIVLGLGFLWIAFDPRKQGLHDKIAKTVVVREDPADRNPPEP